jgi:hypothetical protein
MRGIQNGAGKQQHCLADQVNVGSEMKSRRAGRRKPGSGKTQGKKSTTMPEK